VGKDSLPQFPPLFKRTSSQEVQVWKISVEQTKEGYGRIIVQYGLVNGKMRTEEEVIKEGKNEGRKNATTPLQQAYNEAQSKWNVKKDRKHYGLDPDANESAAKRMAGPMLAEKYEDHKAKIDWDDALAQPKFDGHRCNLRLVDGQITLTSREGKAILTMAHIESSAHSFMSEELVVDGELYSHELSFQAITSAIKRKQDNSEKIHFHAYDLAMPDTPFRERSEKLAKLLRKSPDFFKLVETVPVSNEDQLLKVQSEWVEQGFEGAMYRAGSGLYLPGKRSRELLKVKTWKDEEFLVTGFKEGRGTHKGMCVFICKMPDGGREFDILAPGTHNEKRKFLIEGDQYKGRLLTVKHFGRTTSTPPSLRMPIALRFREEA